MGKIWDLIKHISFPILKHHFLGADSIIILDFIAHFLQDSNIQEISETQAFVALPSFLKDLTQTEFYSVIVVIFQGGDGEAS